MPELPGVSVGGLGMELKLCPFCGSSVELRVLRPGELSVIRCTNNHCYMAFPGAFTSWNNGDTDEHAELRLTTAWNRRAEDVAEK